jgi:hypothetical protein
VRPEECRRGGIRPRPQGLHSSHCARRSAGHAEDVQGTGNGPLCSQRAIASGLAPQGAGSHGTLMPDLASQTFAG